MSTRGKASSVRTGTEQASPGVTSSPTARSKMASPAPSKKFQPTVRRSESGNAKTTSSQGSPVSTRTVRAGVVPFHGELRKTNSAVSESTPARRTGSGSRTTQSINNPKVSVAQDTSPRRSAVTPQAESRRRSTPQVPRTYRSESPTDSPPDQSPSRAGASTGRLIMTSSQLKRRNSCKPDFMRDQNSRDNTTGKRNSFRTSNNRDNSTSGTVAETSSDKAAPRKGSVSLAASVSTRRAPVPQRVSFIQNTQTRSSSADDLPAEHRPKSVTLISQTVPLGVQDKHPSPNVLVSEDEKDSEEPKQFVRLHNPLRRTLPATLGKAKTKSPVTVRPYRSSQPITTGTHVTNSSQSIGTDQSQEQVRCDVTGNSSDEEGEIGMFVRSQSLRVSDLIQRFDPSKYQRKSGQFEEKRTENIKQSGSREETGRDDGRVGFTVNVSSDSTPSSNTSESRKGSNFESCTGNRRAQSVIIQSSKKDNESKDTITQIRSNDITSREKTNSSSSNSILTNINDTSITVDNTISAKTDKEQYISMRENSNSDTTFTIAELEKQNTNNDSDMDTPPVKEVVLPAKSNQQEQRQNSHKDISIHQPGEEVSETRQASDKDVHFSSQSVRTKRRIFETAIQKHVEGIKFSSIANNRQRYASKPRVADTRREQDSTKPQQEDHDKQIESVQEVVPNVSSSQPEISSGGTSTHDAQMSPEYQSCTDSPTNVDASKQDISDANFNPQAQSDNKIEFKNDVEYSDVSADVMTYPSTSALNKEGSEESEFNPGNRNSSTITTVDNSSSPHIEEEEEEEYHESVKTDPPSPESPVLTRHVELETSYDEQASREISPMKKPPEIHDSGISISSQSNGDMEIFNNSKDPEPCGLESKENDPNILPDTHNFSESDKSVDSDTAHCSSDFSDDVGQNLHPDYHKLYKYTEPSTSSRENGDAQANIPQTSLTTEKSSSRKHRLSNGSLAKGRPEIIVDGPTLVTLPLVTSAGEDNPVHTVSGTSENATLPPSWYEPTASSSTPDVEAHDDSTASDRIFTALESLRMELRSLREQDVSLLRQLIAISETINRIQRCRALRVSKSLSFSSGVLHPNQGSVSTGAMRNRNFSFSTRPHNNSSNNNNTINNSNNITINNSNIIINNNNNNNNSYDHYWSCRDVAFHHLSCGCPTAGDGGAYSSNGWGCGSYTTSNSDGEGHVNSCNGHINSSSKDSYPHVFRDGRTVNSSLGRVTVLRRQMSSPSTAEARRQNWLGLHGGSFFSSTDSSISSFDFTSELPSPNELDESSGSLHSLFASAPTISQTPPRLHSTSPGGMGSLLRMPDLKFPHDVTENESQSYEEILWRNVKLWKMSCQRRSVLV